MKTELLLFCRPGYQGRRQMLLSSSTMLVDWSKSEKDFAVAQFPVIFYDGAQGRLCWLLLSLSGTNLHRTCCLLQQPLKNLEKNLSGGISKEVKLEVKAKTKGVLGRLACIEWHTIESITLHPLGFL